VPRVEMRSPGVATLAVSGMTCAGCARTIERVLSRVPGVERATVDFDLGIAIVNGAADPAQLIAAVGAAGYGASPTGENNKRKEQ
jgi:copper chaperone